MGKRKELAGKKFGKVTVESYVDNHPLSGNAMWQVRCDCGKVFITRSSRLLGGTCTQCLSCRGKNNGSETKYINGRGDLYMIRAGDFIKIGVSEDVQDRIKHIQYNCPLTVELIYHGVGEASDEKFWHQVYSHRHHRGEWFNFKKGQDEESGKSCC